MLAKISAHLLVTKSALNAPVYKLVSLAAKLNFVPRQGNCAKYFQTALWPPLMQSSSVVSKLTTVSRFATRNLKKLEKEISIVFPVSKMTHFARYGRLKPVNATEICIPSFHLTTGNFCSILSGTLFTPGCRYNSAV